MMVKHTKLSISKKGENLDTKTVMIEILLILLIAAAIYFAFIRPMINDGKVVGVRFKCGSLVGEGTCVAECDTKSGAQAFPNAFGCPPKEDPSLNICCVSIK